MRYFHKEDARTLKDFLRSNWLLFGCSVGMIFLLTALKNLYKDGQEIFSLQKGALVLELFAPTDLDPELYPIVEESLQSLPGVKEVIAVSPEESLKKMITEKKMEVESEWFIKKSKELEGRGTILPWSYDLHLSQWNEPFLKELIKKIENLEVGSPKKKAISEIHYDLERWTLVFALYNYLSWLKVVLGFFWFCLVSFLFVLFGSWLKLIRERKIVLREVQTLLLFGLCVGLVCHVLYLFVSSISFFTDTFSWKSRAGQFLPFQISLGILFAFFKAKK